MSNQAEYKKKLASAEQAAGLVKSGDWVDYGHFALAPECLDRALAKRVDELYDVKIRAVTYPGVCAAAEADPGRKHVTYNNWHFSAGDRSLHDKGLCNYIPLLYHVAPSHYDNRLIDTDVFICKVAPMDDNGFFNFGLSNSFARAAARRAKTVIVEVNDKVPYVYGGYDESIHISDVDCIVETD
ncbi:MAG TPA: hypothetical protein VMT55_05225, partial [Candidatus Sulfotelmatobacter sp.]|nr:hypothetical protein [Candidatus Sulfotelmatobacter sp.]